MKRRELLTAGAAFGALGGAGARAQNAPLRVALVSPTTGVLSAFGATIRATSIEASDDGEKSTGISSIW